MAVGIEDIDEPMAQTWHVTVLLCILFGIRNIELAIDIFNTKGRIPLGEVRIDEGTREPGGSKLLIEHIDGASVEIGGIKEDPRQIGAKGKSFVDRPGACIIHCQNCMRHVNAQAPAGDGAILAIKQKKARAGDTFLRDDERSRIAVEDGTCRRSRLTTRGMVTT